MNALDGYFSLGALVAAKTTLLLLVAFALSFLARRTSASARHVLWALTFVFLLLIPGMAYVSFVQQEVSIPYRGTFSRARVRPGDSSASRDAVFSACATTREPAWTRTADCPGLVDLDPLVSSRRLAMGRGNPPARLSTRARARVVASSVGRVRAHRRILLDRFVGRSPRTLMRAAVRRPAAKRPCAASHDARARPSHDPSARRRRCLLDFPPLGGHPSRARAHTPA